MPTVPFLPWSAAPLDWAIGWLYLITNAARVFTYLPQIVAVWRCRDGARALSLLTWGSWLVSHAAAILYGFAIVHDTFFIAVSGINFAGCAVVTAIAAYRRIESRRAAAGANGLAAEA